MPAPKLKPELVKKHDPRLHAGSERWVLGRALQDLVPRAAEERDGLADRIVAQAWIMSAPEGMPPYPQRGETYSKAEAGWIMGWVQDVWPVWKQLLAEGDLTADFIRARVSESGWKYEWGYVLRGAGGGDVAGAVRSLIESNRRPYSNSPVYLFDEDGNATTRTELTPAGKTPKEFSQALWAFCRINVAPTALRLRRLRNEALYRTLTDDHDIDAQMQLWEQIDPQMAWRVMDRIYKVHPSRDRVIDPRTRPSTETEPERLRYTHRGPPIPFSQIIHLVRAKDRAYAADRARREAERLEKAHRMLRALARAPAAMNWNHGNVARLLPTGFSIEDPKRRFYYKPNEIFFHDENDKHVLRVSAGTSRAEAWDAVGTLVEAYRRAPEAALRGVW